MSGSIVGPRPLTGAKVLAMLVAFFGIVIGVNLIMAKLAIQTLPGTEVDSAYSASLAYQQEIAAAQAQDARGWKIDALIEREGHGGATLRVEARDRSGKLLPGLKFKGRLERPIDRRADVEITLDEVAVGAYRGSTPDIAPGQWDLVLEADAAGQRMFFSTNRVLLN